MAKHESTAIQDLIGVATRKSLARDSEDELVFRAPQVQKEIDAIPPLRRRARSTPLEQVRVRDLPSLRPARRPSVDESAQATLPVRRTALRELVVRPVPIALLSVGGLLLGLCGYRLLSARPIHDATPTQLAQSLAPPVVTALPIVTPLAPSESPAPTVTRDALRSAADTIATPKPPALIELRLESDPPGAAVTLIDGEASAPLGTTPLSASLDPSRAYDLTFALDGHPTKVEHLDPHATQHLAVTLDAVAAGPARPVRARQARSTGVLMISSKPPCSIAVDGKPTGLTTPQRALALPSGTHTILLVNDKLQVRKSFAVTITPKHATKVIRNLMKS